MSRGRKNPPTFPCRALALLKSKCDLMCRRCCDQQQSRRTWTAALSLRSPSVFSSHSLRLRASSADTCYYHEIAFKTPCNVIRARERCEGRNRKDRELWAGSECGVRQSLLRQLATQRLEWKKHTKQAQISACVCFLFTTEINKDEFSSFSPRFFYHDVAKASEWQINRKYVFMAQHAACVRISLNYIRNQLNPPEQKAQGLTWKNAGNCFWWISFRIESIDWAI